MTPEAHLSQQFVVAGDSAFLRCLYAGDGAFLNCLYAGDGAFFNCRYAGDDAFLRCRFAGDGAFLNCLYASDEAFLNCRYMGDGAFLNCRYVSLCCRELHIGPLTRGTNFCRQRFLTFFELPQSAVYVEQRPNHGNEYCRTGGNKTGYDWYRNGHWTHFSDIFSLCLWERELPGRRF